jgi:hypothetical protein
MRLSLLLGSISILILAAATCSAQDAGDELLHIEVEPSAPAPDRMLDLPPLPRGGVSLIGGTVARMDPIHDRMVVRAFGGRDVTIDFDVRTAVLRGTAPASTRDLRPGTRIYADTILKDRRVFAKTIRIEGSASLGEARGQVTGYDPVKKLLRVRDIISAQPFELRLTAGTEIQSQGQPVQASDLITGTLVHVSFRSGFEGANSAQKIEILARPGSTFTFSGRILAVDLRDQHLTLAEKDSENNFEVALDSLPSDSKLRLKQGMDVVVQARFDGSKYQAQSIEPVPTSMLSSPR